MIPIRHHRDTPIRLQARHTARTALAHDQSALGITGESIGVIRGLLEHGYTLPWRPLPPPIPAHFAEQEVASFFPPYRPFAPDVATAQLLDVLIKGHDTFQLGRDLLYRHSNLLLSLLSRLAHCPLSHFCLVALLLDARIMGLRDVHLIHQSELHESSPLHTASTG